MGWVLRLLARFRAIFSKSSLDEDLDAELIHHLELLTEENVRNGMTEKEARRQARITFGGVEKIRELHREARGITWLEHAFRDLGFSTRLLWKSKGFSFAVIATLAICIGLNTTVYSTLYRLVLEPLPFKDPERIVHIFNVPKSGVRSHSSSNTAQYLDFKRNADMFENIALSRMNIIHSRPERKTPLVVTPDFFELMGVEPILGRFFTDEEAQGHDEPFIVLTQTTWENEYASDPDIVGKARGERVIIGVAPRSLEVLDRRIDFFRPHSIRDNFGNNPRLGRSDLWGRLKPGVTREQAYTQLLEIEKRYHLENSSVEERTHFESIPRPFLLGKPNPYKARLLLLQGGALLVLLVGCINIVNLLLARAMRRCNELSLRHSFGAGKLPLIRLMLCECFLLSFCGALAGLALSWASIRFVNRYMTVIDPNEAPLQLGDALFVSTLTPALAITLIMSLVPFILLWKSGRIQKLDRNSRSSSTDKSARGFGNGLVVSQVAITFILLVGAGLLFRSFSNVLSVDPGFDQSSLVQGRMSMPFPDARSHERIGLRKKIVQTTLQIPGVEKACFLKSGSLVGTQHYTGRLVLRARQTETERDPLPILIMYVSSAFFDTMGIPITKGRSFYEGEDELDTFIVDEAFVETYLDGESALRTEMMTVRGSGLTPTTKVWPRVVGVAKRANFQGLQERDGIPIVYACCDQFTDRSWALVLRTQRSLDPLAREVRAELKELHPQLNWINPSSLDVSLDQLHLDRKGITLLSGVFAGLALVLSAVGIYGVLLYDVQQRQREIGIRSAIGASRGIVLKMILHQGLWKAGIGLGIGLLASIFLTRFLKDRLFDVTTLDPLTFSLAALFLLSVVLVASYLPARRAVRVDPIETLRAE